MKITIITGASRGLGRAAAIACATQGQGVILTYHRNPEQAAEVVRAIEADGGEAAAQTIEVAGGYVI